MRIRLSNWFLLLFILSLSLNTFAQDKAEKALQKLELNYPQEKVHLLFNKDHYVVGENIWFKSFVFEGYNRSEISTTLFVELYDSTKKLIDKKMIPLFQGEGSGNFHLSKTLDENVYYIRAYTTWMTNFSEDFNYLQPITIYNPSSKQKLVPDETSAFSATLHPESGNFIDGFSTKFAVRINTKNTSFQEWTGFVSDSENPEIPLVNFKGFDQNVGTFKITPVFGKNYQLTIQDANGKKKVFNLPSVQDSGIQLQVESTNSAINYSIKSKNISAEKRPHKMIGTINNQLVYKAIFKNITEKTLIIPTEKLINGVLRLTVFDDKDNVLAERLCFVQPDLLKITKPVLSFSKNKEARSKNNFSIAQDKAYDSYTVLITDSENNSSEDTNSVLSTLWLTGDFSSNIDKPAQYFAKNHNSEALDAILISEKWERFSWQNIISNQFPFIKNKPQPYLSFKGKAVSQGKSAANEELNLIFENSNSGTNLSQVKTDSDGIFSLNNIVFNDVMKFSYQLNSKDKLVNSSTQVYMQPDFNFVPLKKNIPTSNMILANRIEGEPLAEKIAKSLSNLNSEKFINEKIADIEEVKIKFDTREKTKKLNKELSSSLFRSSNEMVFDFVNDITNVGGTDVLQWLQGRVPGLQISMQPGGAMSAMMRNSPVSIFLDEMNLPASDVSMVSINEVAMIKVIRGSLIGSSGGSNGAIAIYTRRGGISGDVPSDEKSKIMKEITLKGYDSEEPFKNLIYENVDIKTLQNDTRSTLYWNPSLQSNRSENSPIYFYNNDSTKDFKIIIIGFDKENDLPLYYHEILK